MSREFRKALSCFATGVTVVTSRWNDADWGMTCNSFSSASLDPQLVLWSIRKNASSHEAFSRAAGYTVSVLASHQEGVARQFATGSMAERFADMASERLSSGRIKLTQAAAWFDCTLVDVIPAGDHDILLGQVQDFGWTEVDPLLFAKSQFMHAALPMPCS
jgi:flavin reductase (DIM6/NTAB) family NADH-FMN oxidoreductase RutF